jgi:type II secretory pathway predicted ATPase ExeA
MQPHATSKDPFPSECLDDYFFTTPALRLRLDLVQEYVRARERAVLILGAPGAGKTTLLNQLVCRADHNWRVIRIPAVPSFSPSDVTSFLNAELHLATRAPIEDHPAELDAWLERLATRGQVAVIVVDNAHDLCDESLARLTTLRAGLKSDNLCVVMTGNPELRTRMNAIHGTTHRARTAPTISIPSLDQREVASYIDMRLYHAGLEGQGPFSRATIDDIARSSHGCPRRINSLASGLLSEERKKLHWHSATQNLRRKMRNWLTLAVVTASVTMSSVIAPGSVRAAGEGLASAYVPALPVVRRNRRAGDERAETVVPNMATRALVFIRSLLPGMWSNRRGN